MTQSFKPRRWHNGEAAPHTEIPKLPLAEFRQRIITNVKQGARLAALAGLPNGDGKLQLFALLAYGGEGNFDLWSTETDRSFPALTPECPQAHWFEREIAEQWGVVPEGHPWLKPIRFHAPYRIQATDSASEIMPPSPLRERVGVRASSPSPPPGERAGVRERPPADEADIRPGVTNFFQVQGEEIHEVAVGPVHAGVIEPGHFRFQCHGEVVLHLEISLGYQHRGIEQALVRGPNRRTLHYFETLAGDTSIGHATAYCQAVEALSGCRVPARAQALRAIALELERLANHTGDLGALAGDVGFLPTASFCGRIRGDFLNLTALLCGNRFGRSFLRPGGVRFDVDESRVAQLGERLDQAARDVASAVNLLWDTSSVRARFENTGIISRDTCLDLGLVGPAARACGVERDVRHEFPFGLYRFFQVPVSTFHAGDVFGRAFVRWLEIQRSLQFVKEQLKKLPSGATSTPVGKFAAGSAAVSLVEGWRGEICHIALTDAHGHFARYKITDPSFHNWMGLALAMRNQQVSDFPLCNKSFNLSYCGHDL